MADSKISAMTAAAALGGTEVFPVVQTGANVKTTMAQVKTLVLAGASTQLGAADVDTAPVAQTLRTQGALTGGTSNVAGANWTFIASPGKGTGAGGSIIFQTSSSGGSGNVPNAPSTALTIDSVGRVIATGSIAASGGNGFQFTGRSIIYSSADGLINLGDNNNTAFSGLLLGPSGTAYPSLRPTGTGGMLAVKLADGSANAPLTASTITVTGSTAVSSLPSAAASTGMRRFVTDALTPAFVTAVVGGGAVYTPVYSDGTTWRCG